MCMLCQAFNPLCMLKQNVVCAILLFGNTELLILPFLPTDKKPPVPYWAPGAFFFYAFFAGGFFAKYPACNAARVALG